MLDDELAHLRSAAVDAALAALADEDAVTSAARVDREVLDVVAPTWGTTDLSAWVTAWLTAHACD